MKNLDEWLATTTPFHTFEACDTVKLEAVVTALEDFRSNSNHGFAKMMEFEEIKRRLTSQGITEPKSRSDVKWDDATFAWLCSLPGAEGLPEPLGNDKSRERLGRFPWGDGSPLSYFLKYVTSDDDGAELLDIAGELANRFSSENRGHDNYRRGSGGMCLLGYLNRDECDKLRNLLSRGKWAVSSEEIFDGGVREIAKYLIIVLRHASSRGYGLLLRAHS